MATSLWDDVETLLAPLKPQPSLRPHSDWVVQTKTYGRVDIAAVSPTVKSDPYYTVFFTTQKIGPPLKTVHERTAALALKQFKQRITLLG